MKNRYLIILSIFISLFIWLNIILLKEQTATISLRVNYVNLPREFQLSSLPVKTIFMVTGNGFDILKLRLSDFSLEYDASEIETAKTDINPKYFQIDEISLKGISSIEYFADNSNQNQPLIDVIELPIELVFSNKDVLQLFNSRKYKIEQESVEVRGPENLLRTLKVVKTQPISPNMLKKNKISIMLISPSKRVELLAPSITITQEDMLTITKILTGVSVTSDADFDFFPREVSVRISGLASDIKSITSSDIVAEIVKSKGINGMYPVNVKAPKAIDILDVSPDKVTKITNE